MNIYKQLSATNIKQFAVLIDPDKLTVDRGRELAIHCSESGVDYIFIGGSLLIHNTLEELITVIKAACNIPVILFPGSTMQISSLADGILFLSLISGRNPEMLIGKHVVAAPYLKESNLEIIPTGYMLIDSGKTTTASYMSNSNPIPYEKDDIASVTAMAGEMLGLKVIYLDGGSGADKPVSLSMIKKVKQSLSVPLIIGGGIRSAETAKNAWNAGASVVVVGNAIENNIDLIPKIAETKNTFR